MSMNLKQMGAELHEKRSALNDILEKNAEITPELKEDVAKRAAEIEDLQKAYDERVAFDGLIEKNARAMREMNAVANPDIVPQGRDSRDADTPVVKSVEQLIAEHPEYRAAIASGAHKRGMIAFDLPEFKTTMTTAAGFAPETTRNGVVVPYAVYAPTIEDIVPAYSTTDNAVVYMEETTHTNSNAAASENSALSESAFAYTPRTVAIEDIGAILPVTERQIEDVPAAAALVEGRLALQNRVKRSYYLINGNGSTPQLTGFLAASGLQTQAMGSLDPHVAIYKGITKVKVTGAANASHIVMHPNDWEGFRTKQDGNGVFVNGAPSIDIAPKLWGLPVILDSNIAQGTALVGDFNMFSQIANRKNVTVEFGRTGDDFKYGRFTARVTSRLGLIVYRGAAFCTVTGLSF